MQKLSRREREMREQALLRFYALLTAVAFALIIALISFFNLPGLQDPETGQLPEAASRALVLFPVVFIVASSLLIVIFNRKPQGSHSE